MAKMSEIEIVIEKEAKEALTNFVNTMNESIEEIKKLTIALEEYKSAQHSVHADGWIHTVKKALSKALSFIRFGGPSKPTSRR